jgi:3-deoxy-D-manno-octulosonic-acid transferase
MTGMLETIYDWTWKAAAPLLARNKRLRHGFEQRKLGTPLPRARIWLQAASAGEAHLAVRICRELDRLGISGPPALATTNTRQGYDILQTAASAGKIQAIPAYCPFDAPSLMKKALDMVRPEVMVLLETELWPGLLTACTNYGVPVVVANGRMSSKSFAHYLAFSRLLDRIGPSRILAMSAQDAARYAMVFPNAVTGTMHNIKFDNVADTTHTPPPDYTDNPAAGAIAPRAPFVVFGSLRREEMALALETIQSLLQRKPRTIVGLFPRHMHHVRDWTEGLRRLDIKHVLRSELKGRTPQGAVVVWDVFGELGAAYHLARAAFVGGSLAPLGGQNFLEPLATGIVPVTGPHWRNFAWVGRSIIDRGLLLEAETPADAAEMLSNQLARSRKKNAVRKDFTAYVAERRGGASHAAHTVASFLGRSQMNEEGGRP